MNNHKYDIIIIGSGLGGLICAYILSKNGYKVAVLEKHSQVGGCLQTFKRFGVKFDTGMHYIGSMEKGQNLYRFFNYLNLLDIPLSPLDKNGFDVISVAGKEYKFASGYDNFINVLATEFPTRRKEIESYIQSIRKVAGESPLYNAKTTDNHTFIDANYIKSSINEFISSITSDYRLQNILVGNLPLFAGIKDKTPCYISALINAFYIQSAFRIVGGSDSITTSLVCSIQKFGGDVFTKHEVEEIVCNESEAKYVRMKNGNVLEGKFFISNIHPEATIDIINSTLIRKSYKERIRNLENSISNFTVYIKFKKDTVPYMNHNYYYYDDYDIWKSNDYDISKYPQNYLFMHQCHVKNPKFCESAELLGYMKFEEVEKWANTYIGQRGDDYKVFKEEKAQQLLQKLEKSFPGINAAIESYETSSPLTYRDYTATKHGSMYGIVRDKNFPVQTLISQRTKIPNLFMTGQNINSHGVLGVTIGAIITCSEFLGLDYIIKQIQEANI